MATQLQLRKGTTAQTASFTGAVAEVTVDTTQKTIVVHDGTTVGGNYIVTKGQLDSNVSMLQGINTTQNTNITAVNGYATSAYATANGANGLAGGAFNKANTAASDILVLQGVDTTQNTNITAVNNYAASAYAAANTNATNITAVNGYATSAYATANGANGLASGAFTKANSAYSYTTSVESYAQSAYATANGANGMATGAYGAANTAQTTATGANGLAAGAYNQANTAQTTATGANGLAAGAYNLANTNSSAITIIQGVDLTQNNNITAVNQYAQAAYNKANTGGVFSGTVTVSQDLLVSGNLIVSGNVTSTGHTDLIIDDPIIYIANNNTGNLVDIGIVGNFTTDKYQHTGIVRDATDGVWKLFSNVIPEPTSTVDFTYALYDTLKVGSVTGNLVAQTAVINGIDFTASQATQNTNITSVNQYAASGYALANTNAGLISIIQGVDLGQNTTITAVNNYAASGYAQANTANTRAYASVAKAGDTMSGALTGITNLGTSSVTFDNAYRTSNTFTTASTSQVAVDSFSATTYRSAKYQVQVTSGTDYHVIELLVVHNGTTTFLAQYGEIFTTSSLGTFDTDISGGNVRLLFTGANSVSVVKVIRDAINS